MFWYSISSLSMQVPQFAHESKTMSEVQAEYDDKTSIGPVPDVDRNINFGNGMKRKSWYCSGKPGQYQLFYTLQRMLQTEILLQVKVRRSPDPNR